MQVTVNINGIPSACSGDCSFAWNSSAVAETELSISSLSPTQGSVYGGTLLTIQGAGFLGNAEVHLNGSACNMLAEHMSQTEIVCSTPALVMLHI